jgi:hypothetical protein
MSEARPTHEVTAKLAAGEFGRSLTSSRGGRTASRWNSRRPEEPETDTVARTDDHQRIVEDIAGKLTPAELVDVTRLVSRCPSCYPAGAYEALKALRNVAAQQAVLRRMVETVRL